jgi:phage gp29-like protein
MRQAKRHTPMPAAAELRAFAKSIEKSGGVKESAASSLYTSDLVTQLYHSLRIMPDPDEVLRKAGLTRAALRKLEYDDEIAQAVETRRDAAINTPWRLEGGNKMAAGFITDEISRHVDDLFAGVWNARPYGYSVTQTVYSKGARVGLAWVREMPFEHYFPQRDGTVLYRPEASGEAVQILAEKYLVPVVRPTYRNPYGEPLLSRLYWLWFFRTHGWQYWVQWLEQFGAPFLVGRTNATMMDSATNTKSVDALAQLLDKTRRGSAIAVDKDTEIDSIDATGTGEQFKSFDQATTRQIVKVILGQTLTSDVGPTGGNRALGQVHDEVRQDKRRADIKLLAAQGQILVNRLHEINGFSGDVPQFVMEDEKGLQTDRATRDASLVKSRVLKFTRAYLEDRYDFEPDDFIAPGEEGFDDPAQEPEDDLGPEAEGEDEEGAGKAKKKAPAASKKQIAASLAAMFAAAGARFTPEQQVIEAGVDELVRSLPTDLVPSDAVRAAIREASGPDDLANRLSVALQDADLETFRATFAHALFAAEVIGYVHAQEHAQ